MLLIETSSTDTYKTFIIEKNNIIISNDDLTNSIRLSLNGDNNNSIKIYPNEVLNLENTYINTIYIKSDIIGASSNFRVIGY